MTEMTFGRITPVGRSELECFAVGDDGMAGIRAPVVSDDKVELVAEEIDDLTLRLVTPLQPRNTYRPFRSHPGETR